MWFDCLPVVAGLLAVSAGNALASESNSPAASPVLVETNFAGLVRSYFQLREQLHITQAIVERNQKEAEVAAARNAEALTGRLQALEQTVATQRTQELETVQSSHRLLVVLAGAFAVVGCLAMLLVAYWQMRAVHRLTDLSAALPRLPTLKMPVVPRALGDGQPQLVSVAPVESANVGLLGNLDRLESRVKELERLAWQSLKEGAPPASGGALVSNPVQPLTTAYDGDGVELLLSRAQSFLEMDQPEDAMVCCERVLALEASHPEALVKKGVALERVRRLDEALACYDQAIAADPTVTIAYLHKGGLCNRLERFEEAVECYEKALGTQQKPAA